MQSTKMAISFLVLSLIWQFPAWLQIVRSSKTTHTQVGKYFDKVNDHTIIVQNHATSSEFKSYEQTLKSDNNMDLWYQSGRSYRFICTTADMAQTTNYYMMSEKSLKLELDQKYTLSTFKSPDYYYGPGGMYGDRRKVKVQSSPSYYVDGEKHIPNLHPHSCTQPGAKVFRIDGTTVYAMCNIPGHGMTCSLEENTLKNSIIVTISNGGNLQNITLTKPLIASYNSGKVILKRDGVQAMATKIEIASINDNIANITAAVPNIPFPSNVIHNEVRPQRSNEGIVTNDLNTHYMESRNMRLLKIVHPKSASYSEEYSTAKWWGLRRCNI